MGHDISGLIGRSDRLARIASTDRLNAPARLFAYDLAFLPLDDQNLDCLEGVDFGTPSLDQFTYLTPSLLTWVRNRSVGCDLAYVETRYFGGIGGQGAVLCRGGALAFGPAFDDVGPINEALTRMGVSETAGLDAFDIVGLSHYRGNKAWRDAG